MTSYPAIEHREGRLSRWVRERRIRLALLIAAVELILIATEVLGWFVAVLVAAAVIALWWFVGRRARGASVRQISSTAALSQVLPIFVPLLVTAITTIAIVVFAVFALVAFALLVLDRR